MELIVGSTIYNDNVQNFKKIWRKTHKHTIESW